MKKKKTEIYTAGTKVCKISGNPFKSGYKSATIKDVTVNMQDPKHRTAYTFEEDDSVVNAEMCISADMHKPRNYGDIIVGDILYAIFTNCFGSSHITEAKVKTVVYHDTPDGNRQINIHFEDFVNPVSGNKIIGGFVIIVIDMAHGDLVSMTSPLYISSVVTNKTNALQYMYDKLVEKKLELLKQCDEIDSQLVEIAREKLSI